MTIFYDTTEKTMIDNNQQQKNISLRHNCNTPLLPGNTGPFIGLALNRKYLFLVAAVAACEVYEPVKVAAAADARTAATIRFDIPAQDLAQALSAFTFQSRLHVLYEGAIAQGLRSTPLKGSYRPQEALRRLLIGTSLWADFVDERTVTLQRKSASAIDTGDAVALGAITVKGKASYDPNDSYNTEYTVQNSSTATKTDTPIMETPLSIQVVPKPILKDQQAYRIQDAVKNVSGVQQRHNDGYDNFIVRGFDSTRVGFRNGIRIPLVNLDFANIQQIEVLKGPASVLFGRIEPGGLINAVTKRPQEEAYYSLEQRYGSYDFYRTEANATGAITDDKSLLYRFDLSYLDKNSYRDNIFNDRIFIAPSLTWKPSEKTEINLSFDYFDEDRAFDTGQPVIGTSLGQLPKSRTFSQPGLFDNFESHVIDFNWNHKFNDQWQVRNGVVATFLDEDYEEIYSWTLNDDNRTVDRYAWFGGRNTNSQSVYLDLNGKFETFGVKHNILIGGDYFAQSQTQSNTDIFVDSIDIYQPIIPEVDVSVFRNSPRTTNRFNENSWYGIYFQDQITLWDKLHILGGGRYDITTSGSGRGSSIDVARSNFTDIEKNKFSPRVGVLYQPWHWLSVYGNYVESIGSANLTSSKSGEPLQPETAEQYEAGFKTELFDRRLTSTLAFFHLTKENIATPDPNFQGFSVTTGKARSQGIEIDVSGKLTDELSLIGTYAWTDTKILQDNNDNQGHRLPHVPLHSGSLWLKYDFQQNLMKGFSFGAGVFAADKRYGDTANSFSDGAYARVDMMAAYKLDIGSTRLTTQLNINNISGTKYFNLWGNRAQNLPAEPLTVVGSVRLEY